RSLVHHCGHRPRRRGILPAAAARHLHAGPAARLLRPALVAHLGVQGAVRHRERLQHVGLLRRRHRVPDPARAARDDDRRRRRRLEPDDAEREGTQPAVPDAVQHVDPGADRAGGRPGADLATLIMPIAGMALTYFFVNTVPIAIAIALTTSQNAWRIWKSDFASSAPSYLLGAAAAAVVIKVTETAGYWLTLLLAAAPLYLIYRMYRAGREVEARQGAILEAAADAIVT